jgi:hypothetical protein
MSFVCLDQDDSLLIGQFFADMTANEDLFIIWQCIKTIVTSELINQLSKKALPH